MGLLAMKNSGGMAACALGATLVLLGACGDDEEDAMGDGDGAVADGDGGTLPDTGGSGGTGGTSVGGTSGSNGGSGGAGGGEPPATMSDSGAEPATGGAGGTGGGEPTGGTGGSTDPAPTLPSDGERLSTCMEDDDCNGDDLVCNGGNGNVPGFCTDDCETDDDCPELEGVQLTCSNNSNSCRVECGGDGSDGACPGLLECQESSERCTYAAAINAGADTGSVARWGACESTSDCSGELICTSGTGGGGQGAARYCGDECTENADCMGVDGASAAAECASNGTCRLDCGDQDATCPDGMECSGGQSARCLPSD